MIEIIVDASLFAIPTLALTDDEAEAVLFKIHEVSGWLQASCPVKFVTRGDFDWHLSNAYPDIESIDTFLQMSNLTHVYSAHDLYQTYIDVMQRLGRTDCDEVGEPTCKSVISTNLNLTWVSPTAFAQSIGASLATCEHRIRNGLYSVVFIPSNSILSGDVEIKYEYDRVTCSKGKIYQALGESEGCVTLVTDLSMIFSEGIALKTWNQASDISGIYSSVWLGLGEAMLSSGEEPLSSDIKFSFGSEFYKSLIDHQCSKQSNFHARAWRSCVYYLTSPQKISRKIFRKIPPRKRDEANAFRSHVTKGNPALRLLVWEAPSGVIEFANIGNKKALRIEQGVRDSEYPKFLS